MEKSKVVLFDIDYTLFNTEKYRDSAFGKLATLLQYSIEDFIPVAMQTYDELREHASFDPALFTKQLLGHVSTSLSPEDLEKVWWEDNLFTSCLYSEAKGVLRALEKKDILLGIFSSGGSRLQHKKIKSIAHFFAKEDIHIHALKNEKVKSIMKQYESCDVFVVDDYIPVLIDTKAANSNAVTIWVRRGMLAEKSAVGKSFNPDIVITNLQELLSIFDKG